MDFKAVVEAELLRHWFMLDVDEPEDPTERAMEAIYDAIKDFEEAIDDASCAARSRQLWERLGAMETIIARIADKAADRTDELQRRNQ